MLISLKLYKIAVCDSYFKRNKHVRIKVLLKVWLLVTACPRDFIKRCKKLAISTERIREYNQQFAYIISYITKELRSGALLLCGTTITSNLC